MKLRIRGDSLRLRLTQTEVATLAAQGLVEESTSFGDARLTYALAADLPRGAPLAARLVGARIEVRLAVDTARAWAESETVSLEGTDGALRVLVEKDFACLQERPHEDDADAFPNPNTTC